MGQREGDILDPGDLGNRCTDRQQGALVTQDNLDNPGQGAADAEVGAAFTLDDPVCGMLDPAGDPLTDLIVRADVPLYAEILQRDAANSDQRPGEHFRIAVLAQHITVHVVRVNAQVLGQQRPEPGGIQRGARTHHPAGWHAALRCDPGCQMGEHIDWIRRHQQDRTRGMFDDLRHDSGKDLRISLEQVQARLARSLGNASREDHNPAAGQIRVIASRDLQRMRKRHGMQDIIRFSPGALIVKIDQHHLPPDAAHYQRVSRCGSNLSRPNNSNLHRSASLIILSSNYKW